MIKCCNLEIEGLLFLNLAQNKAKLTAKNVQHGWIIFPVMFCHRVLFGSFATSAVAFFLGKFGSSIIFLYGTKAILSLLQSDSVSIKSLIRTLISQWFIKEWVLIIVSYILLLKHLMLYSPVFQNFSISFTYTEGQFIHIYANYFPSEKRSTLVCFLWTLYQFRRLATCIYQKCVLVESSLYFRENCRLVI